MRASVARPASAPPSTSQGPGRGALTARIEQYSAAAPVAPKTAKLSMDGNRTSSGPPKIANTDATIATQREDHSSQATA